MKLQEIIEKKGGEAHLKNVINDAWKDFYALNKNRFRLYSEEEIKIMLRAIYKNLVYKHRWMEEDHLHILIEKGQAGLYDDQFKKTASFPLLDWVNTFMNTDHKRIMERQRIAEEQAQKEEWRSRKINRSKETQDLIDKTLHQLDIDIAADKEREFQEKKSRAAKYIENLTSNEQRQKDQKATGD
jgi:hypothetical protein